MSLIGSPGFSNSIPELGQHRCHRVDASTADATAESNVVLRVAVAFEFAVVELAEAYADRACGCTHTLGADRRAVVVQGVAYRPAEHSMDRAIVEPGGHDQEVAHVGRVRVASS